MSDLLDQARADMTTFLEEWGESLLRRRATTSYDTRLMPVESWGSSLSFTGDFQPLSGSEMRAEAGLEVQSDGKIEAEYNVDVISHDRVIRDGVAYSVTWVKEHEDHLNIFVAKEVQQP